MKAGMGEMPFIKTAVRPLSALLLACVLELFSNYTSYSFAALCRKEYNIHKNSWRLS